MIGLDGIGFHAIGEMILSTPAPITYSPVSKVIVSKPSEQFKKS